MRKKQVVVGLSIILLLHVAVKPASAGFGFGFSIASWGPLELGISLPGALFFGAAALMGDLGFFDGGRRDRYYASADPVKQVDVRVYIESIDISSDDTLRRDHVRIKYRSLLDEYDRMQIPGREGYLQLQDDGSLSFEELPVKGCIYLHYDKSLSVFNHDGAPVLILKRRSSESAAVLLERSRDSHVYFEYLFGVSPTSMAP